MFERGVLLTVSLVGLTGCVMQEVGKKLEGWADTMWLTSQENPLDLLIGKIYDER